MTLTQAAILGLVEGLTEFIPVSSTGHLILTAHVLGLDAASLPQTDRDAASAFEIVVQAGAWLACCAYYFRLLRQRLAGLFAADAGERERSRRLFSSLGIAFVPLMVAGLLLRKTIKAHLFGPVPVATALVAGGLVMIVIDLWLRRRIAAGELGDVTPRRAGLIGAAQCFALIPGTSRSMSTIVGAMLTGLDARTAADFSFLLAVPTLGAATLYEAWKERDLLLHAVGAGPLAVGLLVAGVAGWASIALFLRLLGRHGLLPWGIYRVLVGACFWLSLAHVA